MSLLAKSRSPEPLSLDAHLDELATIVEKQAALRKQQSTIKKQIAAAHTTGVDQSIERLSERKGAISRQLTSAKASLVAAQETQREFTLKASHPSPDIAKRVEKWATRVSELKTKAQAIGRAIDTKKRSPEMTADVAELLGDPVEPESTPTPSLSVEEVRELESKLKTVDAALQELSRREQRAVVAAKKKLRPTLEKQYKHHIETVARDVEQLMLSVNAMSEFERMPLGHSVKVQHIIAAVPCTLLAKAYITPAMGQLVQRSTDRTSAARAWLQRVTNAGWL